MALKLKIKITTGNAAFDDGNECAEVARILRELAVRVENCNDLYYAATVLRDVNGNSAGHMTVTPT